MTARKPNPWLEEALKFGRANDSFEALDPRANPKSWAAWRDYFRWLNWAPRWFLEVERQHDANPTSTATWTAPIDHPSKFTLKFTPAKGLRPIFPLIQIKLSDDQTTPQERAEHVARLRAQGRLSFGLPGSKFNPQPFIPPDYSEVPF